MRKVKEKKYDYTIKAVDVSGGVGGIRRVYLLTTTMGRVTLVLRKRAVEISSIDNTAEKEFIVNLIFIKQKFTVCKEYWLPCRHSKYNECYFAGYPRYMEYKITRFFEELITLVRKDHRDMFYDNQIDRHLEELKNIVQHDLYSYANNDGFIEKWRRALRLIDKIEETEKLRQEVA